MSVHFSFLRISLHLCKLSLFHSLFLSLLLSALYRISYNRTRKVKNNTTFIGQKRDEHIDVKRSGSPRPMALCTNQLANLLCTLLLVSTSSLTTVFFDIESLQLSIILCLLLRSGSKCSNTNTSLLFLLVYPTMS